MLTDKQQVTLDFIQRYIAMYAVPPKLQEIAEGIGISSRGVAHRYVQALIDAGYLRNDSGKHRGIELLRPNPYRDEAVLPLLGRIAAGKPIEAIPGQDQIDLRDFFGHDNFAIQVQGDSMIEAGIFDGDTVIIEFRETDQGRQLFPGQRPYHVRQIIQLFFIPFVGPFFASGWREFIVVKFRGIDGIKKVFHII